MNITVNEFVSQAQFLTPLTKFMPLICSVSPLLCLLSLTDKLTHFQRCHFIVSSSLRSHIKLHFILQIC